MGIEEGADSGRLTHAELAAQLDDAVEQVLAQEGPHVRSEAAVVHVTSRVRVADERVVGSGRGDPSEEFDVALEVDEFGGE